MTIKTYSAFNYGHTIDDTNKYINFNEGAGELTAEIEIGSYTLGDYINAISVAMNDAGTQAYTVTLDRSNNQNLISITATGNFDLLVDTGTNVTVSAYPLMGFTDVEANYTGLNTYTGLVASGSQFQPQNILQNYVDFDDNIRSIQASVNESASGIVEVISYGKVKFMECNIAPQTNNANVTSIKADANGKENLRDFLEYCITKAPIEFIPDIDNPTLNLRECLLSSSRESKDGVNIKVKQHLGLFEWFESGLLVFREIV